MVRMQIQPGYRPQPSQHDGQLKLCVPPMTINGPSYRLKNRLTAIDGGATTAAGVA